MYLSCFFFIAALRPFHAKSEGIGSHDSLTNAVMTTEGAVVGYRTADTNIEKFLGIPFSKPPVGKNRFRPPQWPAKRNTEFKALNFSDVCIQIEVMTPGRPLLGSEDCLYLNLYRPPNVSPCSKLPVVIFVFGGAFVFGAGSEPKFQADAFVKNNQLIYVTINYRVGPFGFFALPDFEEEEGMIGNWGILDQIQAFRWIKANVANFGGDPSSITIMGESSGAFSILSHLVNPMIHGEGLFHRAIMESTTGDNSWFFQPKDLAYTFYRGYAAFLKSKTGCTEDTLTCIRKIDAHEVFGEFKPEVFTKLFPVFPFGVVIDGMILLDDPIKMVESGNFEVEIPVLVTSDMDDGSIFVPILPYIVPESRLPINYDFVHKTFSYIFENPKVVVEVLKLYSDYSDTENYTLMLGRVIRDIIFACPTRNLARAWAIGGGSMWVGTFGQKLSSGDFHESELFFVLQNKIFEGLVFKNEATKDSLIRLSDTMQCMWTNFMRSGDPMRNEFGGTNCPATGVNLDSLPDGWPRFNPIFDPSYLSLNVDKDSSGHYVMPKMTRIKRNNVFSKNDRLSDEFPSDKKCDFFQAIGPLLWTRANQELVFL